MGYWGVVNNNLKNADIILLVLDARLPEETQNKEIQKKAEIMQTRLILVFNKIDLVNKKTTQDLKEKYPGSFFTNAGKKQTILPLMKYLNKLSEGRMKALRVAVLGYPNVGKSSILNTMTKSREEVSSVSGTTKKTKWIRVGNIRFMDAPGVIPSRDSRTKVALTSSKDIYKTENPERIAYSLMKKLRKTGSLQEKYKIKIDKEDSDYDIFLKIGEKKKLLIKGGEVDEDKLARVIVSDWQKGKIKI
jgi:ribosome biogenesis GTPase A